MDYFILFSLQNMKQTFFIQLPNSTIGLSALEPIYPQIFNSVRFRFSLLPVLTPLSFDPFSDHITI
jgi:hypothetical protein